MKIICPHCKEEYFDIDINLCDHFVECAKCNQQFYIPPMALFDNASAGAENESLHIQDSMVADNTNLEQNLASCSQSKKTSFLAVDDGERIPFKRPKKSKESSAYGCLFWSSPLGLALFGWGISLFDQGYGWGGLLSVLGGLMAVIGFIAMIAVFIKRGEVNSVSIWWD